MKRLLLASMFLALIAVTLRAFDSSPRIITVEPDSAKTGDAAVAKGENLDKANVVDLYLTDGKNDVKAKIAEQSAQEIKFTIPKIGAGRYHLMTANKTAMIEQPVIVTIE
ncbi:MAG TPA: hypothetical protein VKU01_20155 [Bryobacteraceae bacterium]|nr:hypothetical protein [Bryobacteraceae bacterium]